MNRTLLTLAGLAAAAVLFLAVNILAGATLHGPRLDLTQGRLYTLSQGSRRIAARVDEPINLTVYYAERAATDLPQYKSYATRVQEVLGELSRASGGRVQVRVVDPEPFSDAEDAAVQAGLAGPATGRGSRLYFGLVGENSTGQREVIPMLDPSKEEFLEYELTRMVYLLSNPAKKTIGIMAQLPIEGMRDYPLSRGQDIPAWQFVKGLRDYFEVKTVTADQAEIPADLKVLLLVHPKTLSDKALYAVDQFVMRGGRLLVFVDPHCESDVPPGIPAQQAWQIPKASNLQKLFDAWGIELVPDRFAGDRKAAIEVNAGGQGRPDSVGYLAWLGLSKENFSSADAVTGQLERMNFGTAGVLRKKQGGAATFDPLVETSTDSMLIDVNEVKMMPDPKRLLASFVSGGQKLTLAARLGGTLPSAFPAGDPTKQPEPPKEGEPPKPPAPQEGHLAQSMEPATVVVVADCDMLNDRFWIQEARLGGQILLGYYKIADNGDFVVGMVDQLSGSNELIGLRARARGARPFDRVEAIQKDADQKFLAKEQELRNKLSVAEQAISKIIRENPGGGTIILTPEQKAEQQRLGAEMVATRKELRNIQYERNREVERLGTRVKFLNIGLMPVLVAAAAVGLSAYRANRRRAWSRSVGARS